MRFATMTAGMLCAMTSVEMRAVAQARDPDGSQMYPDPTRFEEDIRHFEAVDQNQPPPAGAIVCIGSSSLRGWHDTLQRDLAPLSIIPRGFGGSNMNDALHYADRIVLAYRPRAVVIYEGDNDIAQGVTPAAVAEMFRRFVQKVHNRFPECRIYFLAIKPSPSRWPLWPRMKEANRLIAAECGQDTRLAFVDVASNMLAGDGLPRQDLFENDNLHMTPEGYVIWREALRPVLLESELQYEKLAPATATGRQEGRQDRGVRTGENEP